MILVWVVLPLSMLGQYDLGISNSNYAGIKAASINPGRLADSKLKWDINVLSTGVTYDNTFVYIPKGAVPAFGFRSIIEGILHLNRFATHFDPHNPNKLYNFTLSNEITGPSFLLSIDSDQSIGFNFALRSYATIRNIPGHTAENSYDLLMNSAYWNTPFSDHSTRLGGLSWLEYGFHYGRVIYRDRMNTWKAGISLKFLRGVYAAYARNTNLNYTIADTTGLVFVHSSIDYGRTDFNSYSRTHSGLNHGAGFGASIGVVYAHAEDIRIGLSLLDAGAINFSRNSAAYHLQADSANFSNWRQTHLKNNTEVDQALSAVFYQGDSSRSKTADHFNMRLPTALSLQADWRLCDSYFLNATIVKGFGHGKRQGVIQPDIYAVTPRYERRQWEVSVPLSLIYYGEWRARLGLAVRIWYFYFGGDAPFSLLGWSNMHGVDFYAGIRYFLPSKK